MLSQKKIVTSQGLQLWTEKLSSALCHSTCILISGAGAPAMFWTDPFCERLVQAGYAVIRFDHRDQGLSDAVDWEIRPYTIEDLAQDVMDVLLQNQPAQDFARDLPGFMRSWKILNGSYELDEEIARRYTEDFYIRSRHPAGVAWHHIWSQQKYTDLRDKLRQIRIPGLFIHGGLDPLIPVAAAIETQKFAPQSKMLVIPEMGHMIFNRALEAKIAAALTEHFRTAGS